MNSVRTARRASSVVAAAVATLLGFVLFATPAFATIVGDGSSAAVPPQAGATVARSVGAGGMAGWEISLIAIAASLLSATVAVVADRFRASERRVRISAA
jgi:hypothetical protein